MTLKTYAKRASDFGIPVSFPGAQQEDSQLGHLIRWLTQVLDCTLGDIAIACDVNRVTLMRAMRVGLCSAKMAIKLGDWAYAKFGYLIEVRRVLQLGNTARYTKVPAAALEWSKEAVKVQEHLKKAAK